MKRLLIIFTFGVLISCTGNESADSQPSGLDKTNNNDTSVKQNMDEVNKSIDTTDTTKQKILGR